MDYKEKYEQALERAKKELNACGSQDCDAARQIFRLFPELKESEDERIRIELLNYLYDVHDDDEERARWIAYLEKQSEHANFRNKIQIGDKVTRNRDGVLVNLSQLNRVAKKDEKQGEQKPASKVKPKFRIGDVIEVKPMKCHGKIFTGKPNKITDITDESYILDDGKAYSIELQDGWKLSEPKPVWSEDDKKKYIGELQSLMFEWSNRKENMGICIDRHIDKLLSLHPQSHWKPSDEQMEALANALSLAKNCGEEYSFDLRTLYEQLKKLKS